MNERIRELAEQARIYSHSIHSDPWDRSKDWQDTYNEKFVELIIKEVTDLLDREQWNRGQDWICKDGDRIIERVESHFGVKE